MSSDAVTFNLMNANKSRYCMLVLRHGNLNLDIRNSSLLFLRTTIRPMGEDTRRQSGVPNRMWRYNGSSISGFTRQLRELRRRVSSFPWNHVDTILLLFPCIKKFSLAVSEKNTIKLLIKRMGNERVRYDNNNYT